MSTSMSTELTTSTQRQELQTLQQRAETFATVTTEADYIAALEFVRECRTWRGRVDGYFADAKDKAHKAWKAFCGAVSGLTDPVEALEKRVEAAAGAFRRRQLQAKAEEEARLQREREAAEREEREVEAMMAEEEGQTVAAESIRNAPSAVATVALPTDAFVPEVDDVDVSSRWSAEITSLRELAGGVHRAEVDELALMGIALKDKKNKDGPISSPWLNKRAAEYKKKLNIPGVRAVEKDSLRIAKG